MDWKSGKFRAIAAGAAACSLAISPAISAVRDVMGGSDRADDMRVSLKMLGSIGSFTPVTSDEKLAQAYARAARDARSRGFKFTPTTGTASGERSLTVLVRASVDGPDASPSKRSLPNLGIGPVAYNLGRAKGLAHFVNDIGTTAHTQQAPIVDQPVEMPNTGYVIQDKPSRFSANLHLESREQTAVAPTSNIPATLGSEKTYSVDVSSSYSLTKHLNVKAGLRYKGPDNRLVPLDDQAQDTQAVYLGTTFKF